MKWPQWTLWFWNDSWIARRDKSTSNWWNEGEAGWEVVKIKISDWSLESWNGLVDSSRWSSYLEALTSISEFNVNMLFFFYYQIPWVDQNPSARSFHWSCKITAIKKCTFDQWKWTEYRSRFSRYEHPEVHLPGWNDINNRARYSSLTGYNRPYDWLRSSGQRRTKPQWPRCRRFHSWRWYVDVLHKEALQCNKSH